MAFGFIKKVPGAGAVLGAGEKYLGALSGQNKFEPKHLDPSTQAYLAEDRRRMMQGADRLARGGPSAAQQVGAQQSSAATQRALAAGGSNPMMARRAQMASAAAYGQAAGAAGQQRLQESELQRNIQAKHLQNIHAADVAQYQAAAQAYADQQKMAAQIAMDNAKNRRDMIKNFATGAIAVAG